jgi:O-antigen/teichoic acid export membrane protein
MMINGFVKEFLSARGFKREVFTTFLAQIGGLAFSIITAAIVARWLGPEGKGTLALALLVPGTLSIILNAGIGAANVYFAGSRKLNVPALTENSLKVAIFSTLVGIFIVAILIPSGGLNKLIPGVRLWLILVAMIGLPMGLLNGYLSAILQGLQRIVTVNMINLFQNLLILVLTVLFVVVFAMGLPGALVSYVGSGSLTLVLLIRVLRREGGVFRFRWNLSGMRPVLSFGLKGHIGNIFQFFNYRLDTFFLNYFLGAGGVGIYSVSVGLAELLWNFPHAVGFVIFPKAAASNPETMKVFASRVFRITLIVTTFGAIGLVAVGKPVITLLYSSAFVDAYTPMLILLPGVILLGGAKVLTNELAGWGYPHYNSLNAGVAFILTVILNLTLVPRYGILGAALASSMSYTAIFFMALGFYLTVTRKVGAFGFIS